jgi:hypothetical protein
VVERAAERTERLVGLVELALDARGQYEDVAPGLARFSLARWLVDFRSHHALPEDGAGCPRGTPVARVIDTRPWLGKTKSPVRT